MSYTRNCFCDDCQSTREWLIAEYGVQMVSDEHAKAFAHGLSDYNPRHVPAPTLLSYVPDDLRLPKWKARILLYLDLERNLES